MDLSVDFRALYLAGLCVWGAVSVVTTFILTGWVIALRHQMNVNNNRLAFLEKDYEARHGVHPFTQAMREYERKD